MGLSDAKDGQSRNVRSKDINRDGSVKIKKSKSKFSFGKRR